MKKFLLILIFVSVVSGCTTLPDYKAYEGNERPTSEVAKITTDSENNHNILVGLDERIFISKVDGASTKAPFFTTAKFMYPQTTYVLPGEHKIEVLFAVMNQYAYGLLTVNAEAGHEYIIKQKNERSKVQFFVEEVPKSILSK